MSHRGRQRAVTLVALAAALVGAFAAGIANGDTANMIVVTSPAGAIEGEALAFTVSGTTTSQAAVLYVFALPAGTTCPGAPPSNDLSGQIMSGAPAGPGQYSVSNADDAPAILAAGSYDVCGWLADWSSGSPVVVAMTSTALTVAPLTPTVTITTPAGISAQEDITFHVSSSLPGGIPVSIEEAVIEASKRCAASFAREGADSFGGTGPEPLQAAPGRTSPVVTSVVANMPTNGRYRICVWITPAWSGADVNHVLVGPISRVIVVGASEALSGTTSQGYPVEFNFQYGWSELAGFSVFALDQCEHPVYATFRNPPGLVSSFADEFSTPKVFRVKAGRLVIHATSDAGGMVTVRIGVRHALATGTISDVVHTGTPMFHGHVRCTSGVVTFAAQ